MRARRRRGVRPARAAVRAKRTSARGIFSARAIVSSSAPANRSRSSSVDDERRDRLEHVHTVPGDLAEDPVVTEERHHDQLREEPGLDPLQQLPGARSALRLGELDRPHQPEPAHVANDLEALDERARPLQQPLAEGGGALDQPLLVELPQRRQPRDHREVVRGEGRAVADRIRERVEDPLVDLVRHQQRTDGDVAARERLGHRDQVGLEAPVLQREHSPGPPEARLHLVHAEERPVAAAELLRALEVAVRRQVDALSLDGLDEEERDVLGGQLQLERREVAPRDLLEAGQQRPEARRPLGVRVRGERPERQAVEPVLGRQNA